jgi:hypothetical protein
VAVKKATVKKIVAKKTASKKSTSIIATAKTRTVAKKSISKKTAAKKPAIKKAPAKKAPAKKAPAKKAARRKSVAKKGPTKSAAKPVDKFVVPPVPVSSLSRAPRVEVNTVPLPVSMPFPPLVPVPPKKTGASGRVVFAVVVGIVLLSLIVWSRAHNRNTDEGAKALPTPSATFTPTASATPTPSASPTPNITAHTAPQGVVAQYTTPGATIFWKAPTAIDGLTGYNVEISRSNGPWKLISTLPSTQTSLNVVKSNANGWTSFRVSSVYSDSQITSAKAFGLPGTYS